MTRDEFQSKNSIESVLRSKSIKLVGSGNARKAVCPFHADKKPSMAIDLKRNVWYCHAGCGKGGVIDLLMKLEGLSFAEFAKKHEIDQKSSTFKRKQKSLFSEMRPKRVAEPETVREPGEDSVIESVYSYQDALGREVFQTVRYKPKDFRQRHRENGEWVWNLQGVERVLYHLPDVLKSKGVWICEGEKDCDNLIDLGYNATTSPMGASSWIDSYADALAGKDVALCGDNDEKGKAYIQAVLNSLSGKAASVRLIELPSEHKDVSDFIASFKDKKEARNELLTLHESATPFIKGYQIHTKTMAELQRKYKQFISAKPTSSFNLGDWIPDLKEVRALVPGEVVLVIGGTGTGKTALGSNIALAALPLPTLIVELELPDELLFERLVAAKHKLTCEQVDEEYAKGFDLSDEALHVLFKNLFICSESVQTVEDIEHEIVRSELKTGVKVKVCVIDYVQLLSGKGNRRERVSDAAEEIKRMAKRRKVIVILISQVARPEEGKREVNLWDAKESGSLENSSGLVLGIWLDEKDRTLLHGRVLKNTKGKAGRRFHLNFDGAKMIIGPRGYGMGDGVKRFKESAD